MTQNKTYLFANWKMYLDYDESNILANALAEKSKKFSDEIEMTVFPSALSLYPVAQTLSDVKINVGPQNIYWVDKGGYTGETSAQMFKAAGSSHALIGHSERRHLFHETNHDVRQKIEASLNAELTPVLCVGETEKERDEGKTEEIVEIQLRATLEDLNWPKDRELIVAYEPVWAIGTGNACDPAEAERMHDKIFNWIKGLAPGISPVLLYGGSVRGENVEGYLQMSHINGVLVGGSSAKLESWMEIIENSTRAVEKL
ncbi:triose-phosphate isomerase [Patescibacteria group bacterium]|nr:triose-phosphate isomerase [Patescibacteria group bacterium]